MPRLCLLLLLFVIPVQAQWADLLANGLDGWEIVGDGVWSIMQDGTLLGQRKPGESSHQSWLYTRKEFGEYDLQLRFWTPLGTNSGISIRDKTRARWAHGENWDREKTPSHYGYEVQISNRPGSSRYPTGSIYLFATAKGGEVNYEDWNQMEIRSRNDMIRIRLNGKLVTEHPGAPERSKTGPIGLQLHDARTVIMFRDIRIREIR